MLILTHFKKEKIYLQKSLTLFMNSLTQMNVGQLFSKVILVIAQKNVESVITAHGIQMAKEKHYCKALKIVGKQVLMPSI